MTDKMVYDAGKGDRYRKVDSEKFANNYDLIFGKKNDKNSPSTERALASTSQEKEKTDKEK